MTLLQRSKLYLEGLGYTVEKVEHWNAFARKMNDLWGFADLLAISPRDAYPHERSILAVQVTSRSNMSARRHKIAEHPNTPIVREAGIAIAIHGWRQKVKRGKWDLKVEDVS